MKYGTRLLTPNAHRSLLSAKRRARIITQTFSALLRDLRAAIKHQVSGV